MTKEVSGAKENNTDANWDLYKEIRGTRGTKFAGEIKGFFFFVFSSFHFYER